MRSYIDIADYCNLPHDQINQLFVAMAIAGKDLPPEYSFLLLAQEKVGLSDIEGLEVTTSKATYQQVTD